MLLMGRANKTRQKAQSHVHAKSYFGEFDASVVVDWLNSKDRPQANDPVETLLKMNQGLPFATNELKDYLAELVRRSKLAVAPVLGTVGSDRWEVDWRLVGRMPPMVGLAIVKLLHLADKGLIGRVRQCAEEHTEQTGPRTSKTVRCEKWFYARFEHQRFHSTQCQERTFKTSPTWKKQRAEYMKRLRQEKKLRERKWMRGSPKRKGKR
jgi:hypothetical protein